MSQEKVEAVLEWKSPSSLIEVQSFLGFANFYRRFIQDYSRVARPLTELTKGNAKDWRWTPEAELAFKELNNRFMTALILAHFDPQKPVIVETDASDFALGAILSQRDHKNCLHPVAFHSRKFSPAEINYEIHDKELLAIVDSFKHWRRYCEGAVHQVQVFWDHQNLEYFTTTKVLNRRQARWAQELAGIDFKIFFRPGSQNCKPDALSRHSEYCPEKGGSKDQPITMILHPSHFSGRISAAGSGTIYVSSAAQLSGIPARRWSEGFAGSVWEAGQKDPEYRKVLEALEQEAALERPAPNDSSAIEEVTALPHEEQRAATKARREILELREGMVYWKGLLWVPNNKDLIQRILESEHDTKVAGHMGQDKTIELIRRNFWWPKMDE